MNVLSPLNEFEELLTPRKFLREQWAAHLYAPYSRKLRRRVYVYTHNAYDLWVLLESDPDVEKYNERPLAIPVVLNASRAVNASPACVSVNKQGVITVHTLNAIEQFAEADQPQAFSSIWEAWANAKGYRYQDWTPTLLHRQLVWLSNLKVLLRYVCYPDYCPSQPIEHAVLSALKERRQITFNALAYQLEYLGRDAVEATMAALIVDRKIFSDIDRTPFSQMTELSAYHEIT